MTYTSASKFVSAGAVATLGMLALMAGVGTVPLIGDQVVASPSMAFPRSDQDIRQLIEGDLSTNASMSIPGITCPRDLSGGVVLLGPLLRLACGFLSATEQGISRIKNCVRRHGFSFVAAWCLASDSGPPGTNPLILPIPR